MAVSLCPDSVQEAFELTTRAFNLAEKYRTAVILFNGRDYDASSRIFGHTALREHRDN